LHVLPKSPCVLILPEVLFMLRHEDSNVKFLDSPEQLTTLVRTHVGKFAPVGDSGGQLGRPGHGTDEAGESDAPPKKNDPVDNPTLAAEGPVQFGGRRRRTNEAGVSDAPSQKMRRTEAAKGPVGAHVRSSDDKMRASPDGPAQWQKTNRLPAGVCPQGSLLLQGTL